jgi:hypothetical protein
MSSNNPFRSHPSSVVINIYTLNRNKHYTPFYISNTYGYYWYI